MDNQELCLADVFLFSQIGQTLLRPRRLWSRNRRQPVPRRHQHPLRPQRLARQRRPLRRVSRLCRTVELGSLLHRSLVLSVLS